MSDLARKLTMRTPQLNDYAVRVQHSRDELAAAPSRHGAGT
jgi:hypothetical protein